MTIPIRLENDPSIHRPHHPNQIIIVVNGIAVIHRRPVDVTKNRHEDVVQVAAVIVVATIRVDLESIHGVTVHRPTIEQANQVKAATNVINIQEKKATREVLIVLTVTNVVAIE